MAMFGTPSAPHVAMPAGVTPWKQWEKSASFIDAP
jgi:hypothetical protein